MNKTVSINLGGIFFHIEEDAYTKLEGYLDSINRHFASEEVAEEIVEDIEARIAEIFQETLAQNKRQVVLPSDVNGVIDLMGLPDQFGEPEMGHTQANAYQKAPQQPGNHDYSKTEMPKGERASNRKKSRRLYRDPDEAFMGGVCAGLSSYFGIEDPIWIRMAFAISFFTGGWGLLPYILLWSIVPEAKTPAQKLAMRGEPINVSNIEKMVKEGMDNIKTSFEDFNKSENGQKTRFFFKQATTEVKKSAPKVFKLGGSVLKVFLIVIGTIMLLSLGTALIAILGSLFAFSKFLLTFVFSSSLPLTMVSISTFFLFGIPIFFIGYAVVRRSFNVRLKSASWARGLSILWILSLVSLVVVGGTTYDNNFSTKNSIITPTQALNTHVQTLNIEVLEDDYFSDLKGEHHHHNHGGVPLEVDLPDMRIGDVIFDTESEAIYVEKVQLDIEQSESDDFEIVKKISARGGSTQTAQKLAENIEHKLEINGERLAVSPFYKINQSDKWRFQQYKITLKVPVGKAVYFDEALYGDRYEVIYDVKNVTNTFDGDMVGKTWLMTEAGLKEWKTEESLITLEVADETDQASEATVETFPVVSSKSLNNSVFDFPPIQVTDHTKKFDITEFTNLDIAGSFNIYVERSDVFDITLVSREGESKMDKVNVERSGNTLDISMNNKWWFFSKSNNNKKLDLYITMPELSEVELGGTSHLIVKNFDSESFEFDISGASSCNASVEAEKLIADMSGASHLSLVGNGDRMFLELSGASTLNAYDFEVNEMEAELSGASNGHIHVTESLDVDLSGASQLLYIGSPSEVRSEKSGVSHLTRVTIE